MKDILFVNNGSHYGIASVGNGYIRAFEKLGIDFRYLNLFQSPRLHAEQMNILVRSAFTFMKPDIAIFLQPTYFDAATFHFLMTLRNSTKFYSIQTEDPYSVFAMFQMNPLFSIKFTNEKIVAESMAAQGYRYLPTAFDSLQPYLYSLERDVDFSMICNYYPNRLAYLECLKEMDCKKIILGNIGYAMHNGLPIDMTCFTGRPGMVRRHKEYEIYSQSKYVVNPHRDPLITGKSNFLGNEKECRVIFEKAISPNPRFFDALGCGAFPLNEAARIECHEILKDCFGIADILLPVADIQSSFTHLISKWNDVEKALLNGERNFLNTHTYMQRAQEVLGLINL